MAKKTTSFKDYLLGLVDEELPVDEKKKKKRTKKESDKDARIGLLKYLMRANVGN